MLAKQRRRNYEKYAESAPSIVCRAVNKPDITIACVIKSATYDVLSYECSLINLTEANYINILTNKKIDLVLVESSYLDNTNDWLQRMQEIFEFCKSRKICTVIWDTSGFLGDSAIISNFDFIFTVNNSRIEEYKESFKNKNVFYLPFAVQPHIINPTDRNIMNKENLFLSHTDIELNRVHGSKHKIYSLLYKKAIENVIPKEIFELMATGTFFISPYSDILGKEFPEIIKLYESEAEMQEILSPLLRDNDAIDKLSVIGQRCVFTNYTYESRLDTILHKTGITQPKKLPGVSMVTSTNRPDSMENVFKNYENQLYENKELIVILNNNKMDLGKWNSKAAEYENVKVFQIDEAQPLGICLNHAIDNSDYPYFSKCDDDNYYAPNFLSDLMNTFKYADTEIVGKLTYYCYLEGCRTLAMMCPNMEYRYVNMLSGSALIIKREVFDSVRFKTKPFGSDTVFLRECLNNGVRMYSSDRFNYVYKRHASQENHTWKAQDDVFLRSCKIINVTDDFISTVTV